MFDELRDHIISIITSRLTVLTLVFCAMAGALIYRCFNLQIVNGEEYLNDFILQTEKTRDIASSRGCILDRNGKVLAYNELAYSVKIEDVFESNKQKNANLNDIVYRLIKMIEGCGDDVISDFKIYVDEDGEFAFSAEGTSQLRFLADVYDHKTIDELTEEEKASTPLEVMQHLSKAKGDGFCFAIGEYEEEGNSKSDFIPGKGYTNDEWLKMVTIRYAMS